jgi:hypothetical protein
MKIEKMTIVELREKARLTGLRGFWVLNRQELVDLLFPPNQQNREVDEAAPKENQEDQGETNKHHQPQQHDAEQVGVKDV